MALIGLLFVSVLVVIIGGLIWVVFRTMVPPVPPVQHAACGSCGYAVKGLESFTCPECGRDLRDVGIVTPAAAKKRSPGITAGVLAWSVLFFIAMIPLSATMRSTPIAMSSMTVRSHVLTPVSGSFMQLSVKSEEWESSGVSDVQSLLMTLTTDDGQSARLSVDAVAGSFTAYAPDGSTVAIGNDLSAEAILEWFRALSLPTDTPNVELDAAELAASVPGMLSGQWSPGPRYVSNGMSVSMVSRPRVRIGSAWIEWLKRAAWIAVWIGGIVLIVRMHSRARRRADALEAGTP